MGVGLFVFGKVAVTRAVGVRPLVGAGHGGFCRWWGIWLRAGLGMGMGTGLGLGMRVAGWGGVGRIDVLGDGRRVNVFEMGRGVNRSGV